MPESYLILRNVHIPGRSGGLRGPSCDLLLLREPSKNLASEGPEKGKILRIAPSIRAEDTENGMWSSYNAKGCCVTAAFFDSFCRFGSADYYYRENPSSGGGAAKAGGFGSLFLFPQKRIDSFQELRSLQRRMRESGVRVYPAASLFGAGFQANSPARTDFSAMREAADFASALFTDEGADAVSDAALLEILRGFAKSEKVLFCVGRSSPPAGNVNEGRVARLVGDAGISPVFERLYVASYLLLSEATGCRIHFPIISEGKCVAMIRKAKKAGIPVSCGTSPLYFALTDSDFIYRGTSCKVYPPLRSEQDRTAILEGLADGTIDCLCSGHTPLSVYEKQGGIQGAKFGAAGLETAFSAGMTYLVESGQIPIERFLYLLNQGPAALVGKNAAVEEGSDADLVLLDLDAEVICSDSTMKSRSHNTPFLGMALRGRVDSLLLGGRFVYRYQNKDDGMSEKTRTKGRNEI